MTSPAYRACVARLEKLLSPRVASRTLHMGMQQQGVTAETASAADLEPIMKGPVFKQLQVAAPVAKAREAVGEILGAMQRAEDEAARDAGRPSGTGAAPRDAGATAPEAVAPTDAAPGLRTDAPAVDRPEARDATPSPGEAADAGPDEDALARVAHLRERMRPYNLYFEWPEVRRLRAQLQRLDDEARSGGDVEPLAQEIEEQLALVAAKLEDMLVLQAKDLAELEEILDEVQPLGGVKVRRLESLVKHVRDAQASRQLVEAEIERSRTLAHELRKLMASSVFQDGEQGAQGPDALRSRLAALDLEAERQDLERLARAHAMLLEHDAELAARVAEARELVAQGSELGDRLARLQEDLPRAQTARRQEVEDELASAAEQIAALPEDAAADLARELEVLRSVLETGLPSVSDLVRFRDLLELARDHAERAALHTNADEDVRREDEERAAERARDLERLHGYEREAERLADVGEDEEAALQEALARARDALAAGAPGDALDEVGERVDRLAAAVERRLVDLTPRLDAALATFRSVERLNSDEVASVRRILTHLDTQRDAFDRISLGMRARLEASLQEAEDLLGVLVEEERATRAIADQLMAGAIDDMFGLFGSGGQPPGSGSGRAPGATVDGADGQGPPPPPAHADPPSPIGASAQEPGEADRTESAGSDDPALTWVREQGERRGVAAAALLTRGASEPLAAHRLAQPTSARLPVVSDRLLAALDDLGAALGLGTARLVTLEGPQGALIVGAESGSGRTVALLATHDVAALGLLTHDLREGDWTSAASASTRRQGGPG